MSLIKQFSNKKALILINTPVFKFSIKRDKSKVNMFDFKIYQ